MFSTWRGPVQGSTVATFRSGSKTRGPRSDGATDCHLWAEWPGRSRRPRHRFRIRMQLRSCPPGHNSTRPSLRRSVLLPRFSLSSPCVFLCPPNTFIYIKPGLRWYSGPNLALILLPRVRSRQMWWVFLSNCLTLADPLRQL